MKTIVNKKGNVGYLVEIWNLVGGVVNMPSMNPAYSARANDPEIIITVRPVEVKSCGKKQMTLRSGDNYEFGTGKNDDMTGRFFDPATPIYATEADARDAAKELFEQILLDSKENFERRIAAQEAKGEDFLLKECKTGLAWVTHNYYELTVITREQARARTRAKREASK